MKGPADHLLRYLITKGHAGSTNFDSEAEAILRLVAAAVRDGVEMVQLREKGLEARPLLELATQCARSVRGTRTRLLINERFDIAIASGADGVHLTSTSMPIAGVRKALGKGMIVGVSTHTVEEVEAASRSGADFALFGPVFSTPGKSPRGIAAFEEVCKRSNGFPVLAVGGVSAENLESVAAAGGAGYAAIRSLASN